jgi:hypothetical protein
MIEVCHRVNGRMRLRVPSIHQDQGVAERILTQLRRDQAILRVRANPACSSLVIHYDATVLHEEAIKTRLIQLIGGDGVDRSRLPPSRLKTHLAKPSGPGPRVAAIPARKTRTALSDWISRMFAGHRNRRKITIPEEPNILDRLNLRLTRWMLKTSMRSWWYEVRFGRLPTRKVRKQLI